MAAFATDSNASTLRVWRGWLPVALVALLGGCTFEVPLPEGVQLTCSEAAPLCPAGLTCQRTLGRCLPASSDREAPRLLRSEQDTAWLRRGQGLSVTLWPSEPLAGAPLVGLVQGATRQALAPTGRTDDGGYTLALPADAPLEEGPAALVAVLVDGSGNESGGLPVGAVTVDFTPPEVLGLRVVSPREADGGLVEVRPEEAMQVRVTLTEQVGPGLALVQRALDCAAPDVSWQLGALSDRTADFWRGPLSTTQTCTWSLTLEGLADLAGNEALAATSPVRLRTLGEALRVDAPLLYRVQLDGGLAPARTFSRVPGYSVLEAHFGVPAGTTRLTATFDQEPLAGCTLAACEAGSDGGRACRCTRPVAAADSEGFHVLTVQATDGAGQQRTVGASARFDFTPPSLVAAQVLLEPRAGCPLPQVSALSPGGTARVLLAFDEPAGETPAVSSPAPWSLAFSYASGAGNTFSLEHQLHTTPPDGEAPLEVRVTDEVGNSTVLAPQGLVVPIDATAPSSPAVDEPERVVLERAPWGDPTGRPRFELRGASGAAPPASRLRVLSGPDAGAEGTLALVTSDADGGFLAELPNVDRTEAWVQALDPACNPSPPVAVRDFSWRATLGGKVPGAGFPNPHTLEAWGEYLGEAARRDAIEPADVSSAGADDGALVTVKARPSWWPLDGVLPSERGFMSMAWDAARQRMVLFGGQSPTTARLGDTWEFGPRTWGEVTPVGDAPVARSRHRLAFDPLRRRTVLFGGTTAGGSPGAVLEWDGASWRDATPTGGPQPSPRNQHALAWDGNTGKVLLFGGVSSGSAGTVIHGDTWSWDGVRWEQLAQATPGPSPRIAHTLAWDEQRRRVVLFGGTSTTGTTSPTNCFDDTWEWDGATWTQVVTSPRPAPRAAAALAYDSVRRVMVLFGGQDNTIRGDTWTFDGTAWTQRAPAASPAARTSAAAAFDEVRGVVVMFGGFLSSTVASQAVWEFDGATWRWRSDPAARPPGRYGASAGWDPVRRRAVLFGGRNAASGTELDLGDTWEWDDLAWRRVSPDAGPSPRAFTGAAWSPARGRFVVFGGVIDAGRGVLGDTWEWDGTSWTEEAPDGGGPPPRSSAASAVDPQRGDLVMLGGAADGGILADVWGLGAGGWAPLPNATLPSPRWSHAAGWDPVRAELLIVNGIDSPNNLAAASTWIWDGARWRQATSASPPARRSAPMAWDPVEQRLVLHAGFDLRKALDDQWAWDGASWTEVKRGPRHPPGAIAPCLLSDPGGQRLLRLAGRLGGNVDSSQVWSQQLDPRARVAFAARLTLDRAGLGAGDTVQSLSTRWRLGGTGGGSTAVPGVVLEAWNATTLTVEGSHSAPHTAPAELTWSTSDPARLAALVQGPRQELLLVASSAGANADGAASLALDYLEVIVRYRRP